MDFAPEPVRDAFPPPQTRSAPANAAPADENGRTFDDHLEAANEPERTERPSPPQTEQRVDRPAPVEARSTDTDDADVADDDVDADTALLGGPLPSAPAPMPAPVAIQIAAGQAQQAPQTQSESDDAALAPVIAPEMAAPETAAKDTANAATAEPVAPEANASAKGNSASDKDTAPKAAAPNADAATTAAQPESDAAQTATQQPTAPTNATGDLPQAVQQAIAATITPAAQTTSQTTPRATKDAAQAIDAKAAPDGRDGKADAAVPPVKARTPSANAADNGKVTVDAAPAPPPQSVAPDASQLADSSAISTTASQASTHVQQASAETGAQRAAPASAQVGREIVRRANSGTTSFELRLDPADLGRVEVRMEVTRDHRVTAVITADDPQALTELARGARDLEQQLQAAGLQLSENGLSFDLRQGAQGDRDASDTNTNSRGERNDASGAAEQHPAPVARPIGYERWRGVRVDMMV